MIIKKLKQNYRYVFVSLLELANVYNIDLETEFAQKNPSSKTSITTME